MSGTFGNGESQRVREFGGVVSQTILLADSRNSRSQSNGALARWGTGARDLLARRRHGVKRRARLVTAFLVTKDGTCDGVAGSRAIVARHGARAMPRGIPPGGPPREPPREPRWPSSQSAFVKPYTLHEIIRLSETTLDELLGNGVHIHRINQNCRKSVNHEITGFCAANGVRKNDAIRCKNHSL